MHFSCVKIKNDIHEIILSLFFQGFWTHFEGQSWTFLPSMLNGPSHREETVSVVQYAKEDLPV